MVLDNFLTQPALETTYAVAVLVLAALLSCSAWLALVFRKYGTVAWRISMAATGLAVIGALLQGWMAWQPHGTGSMASVAGGWLRVDPAAALMLLLTGFLGWVVLRYSRQYLEGDAGRERYLGWLSLTLLSIYAMIVSNHLLMICLSWTATSLFLHQLLTFYEARYAAQMAAHKKFIVSRIADVMTLSGCAMVLHALGTLRLDEIHGALVGIPPQDTQLTIAACLFAFSAILKCAQIPFHGWLLQVMEAPTPVSALLHAGIVNIGGFLLISLGPLVEFSRLAAALLVISGGLTALVAALVMMTRVSVKLSLAWSTVAQMGFMLVEIGLGAYSLALLHLVGHSLYKAHAFLTAGETVFRYRLDALWGRHTPESGFGEWAIAILLGIVLMVLMVYWGLLPKWGELAWLAMVIVLIGWLPMVTSPSRKATPWQRLAIHGLALGVIALYAVWHEVFQRLLPQPAIAMHAWDVYFACACLLILLSLQMVVLLAPEGRLSRWLHPRAFAGFHMDEIFTRMTLAIWPVRLRRAAEPGYSMTMEEKRA